MEGNEAHVIKQCELHIGTCLGVSAADSVNNLDTE